MAVPKINFPSDLLTSGDVANPAMNQVLVDSGVISVPGNQMFFDLSFTLQSTVAATFEMGIFDSNGIPLKTFKFDINQGQSAFFNMIGIPITDQQKISIRAANAVIGTVNVAINTNVTSED